MPENRQIENCERCDQKDKRIAELETMIRRFAESFDEYEEKIERRRKTESGTLMMVVRN